MNQKLHSVLDSYRQTPHPATGIPPAAMIFRDGMRSKLPRQGVTEMKVTEARILDAQKKGDNESQINSSKYRKQSSFEIGDIVWIRNYKKQRKFDPLFITEPYQITNISTEGNKITVKNTVTNSVLCRHPDDIKPCRFTGGMEETPDTENIETQLPAWPEYMDDSEDHLSAKIRQPMPVEIPLRRSTRERWPNSQFQDYVLDM